MYQRHGHNNFWRLFYAQGKLHDWCHHRSISSSLASAHKISLPEIFAMALAFSPGCVNPLKTRCLHRKGCTTPAASAQPTEARDNSRGQGGKKPAKWKQQSAQLRAAMLANRPDKLGQAAAAIPGAVIVNDVNGAALILVFNHYPTLKALHLSTPISFHLKSSLAFPVHQTFKVKCMLQLFE